MWVEVDGGRVFVETTGDGPPLLLLHGWPLDHRMFEPQIEALSSQLQLILCDRRGYGRSDAPPDLRRELDDVDRILDTLELQTVHLLGMSQGGRIAMRYAATRQKRLRSLLLQGAVVDGLAVEADDADRIPLQEYAELARTDRLDEVRRRWLRHPLMRLEGTCGDEPRLLQDIMTGYSGRDLIDFDADSYAFDGDVVGALKSLRCPMLLLTGTRETAARKQHARTILSRAPDAREVLFEHSGHLSNLSEPEAYNRAVLEFCAAVEAARSNQAAALLME